MDAALHEMHDSVANNLVIQFVTQIPVNVTANVMSALLCVP